MNRESVFFDQTEVTMIAYIGNRAQALNLTYDRIVSVTLELLTVRRLFGTAAVERIGVRVKGYAEPFWLRSDREGAYFEGFKEGFRTFCRRNSITLYDKLA